MRPEHIDWDSGDLAFWDLEFLDPAKPLSEQTDGLKEDLAQVRYPNAVTIDVGWYPEFLEAGEFVIRVIREPDWDIPLFVDSRSSVDGLLTALKGAILIAKKTSETTG